VLVLVVIQPIDSVMHNDFIVVLAGSVTRTLQDVQNEKSEQQLEVYVSTVLVICLCSISRGDNATVHTSSNPPLLYGCFLCYIVCVMPSTTVV